MEMNTINLKMTVDGKTHDIKGFSNDVEKSKEECASITESSNKGFACKEEISNSKITKINPIEFLNSFNENDKLGKIMSKIEFDKNLKTEFIITNKFSCDGTFALIDQGIMETVIKVLTESPLHFLANSSEKIELEKINDFKYILGEITLKSEYGIVDLKCGRYPGETDIVTIPVKIEYIQ